MVDRDVGARRRCSSAETSPGCGSIRRVDPAVLLARLERERVARQAVLEDDRGPGQDGAGLAVGADGHELQLGPPALVAVAPDEHLDGDPRVTSGPGSGRPC